MDSLSEIGIRFSQDDFREGFSSLSYLTKLDLTTIKISKSFLDYISSNEILINSMMGLFTDLGFVIIVEGIEDKVTLVFFRKFEDVLIQGYYFYKPLPFTMIKQHIKDNK